MKIGEKIREARKVQNLSQEDLAGEIGISVQAVSKWECGQSCPDIMHLPHIADYLGVSLDDLLREETSEFVRPQRLEKIELPDDGKVRIFQCIGNRVITQNELEGKSKKDVPVIPLAIEADQMSKGSLCIEIWGSAQIEGFIQGDVSAETSVACEGVQGEINAGGSVTCEGVQGDVNAGGSVTCADVAGDVNAGGSVTCADVAGDVNAGGSVTCADVAGDVSTGGSCEVK